MSGQVTFSPDGNTLAAANDKDVVQLWDLTTGRLRGAVSSVGTDVAFSPDGATLAVGNWQQDARPVIVRLYGVKRMRLLRTIKQWDDTPIPVRFDKTGSTFTVTRRFPPWLWHTYSGNDGADFVVFSADGSAMARVDSTGHDGAPGFADASVEVWEARRRRRLFEQRSFGQVFSASFSPDGRLLAVADNDGRFNPGEPMPGSATIIDVGSAKVVRGLLAVRGGVYSTSFSPDGRSAAVTSMEYGFYTVTLCDVGTGQVVRSYGTDGPAVFSPDGKLLAAPVKGEVVIWSTPRAH